MAGEAGAAIDVSHAMIATPVTLIDWLPVAPVIIPIVFGAVLLMLRHREGVQAIVAIIAFLLTLAANIMLLARVLADGPQVLTMGRWLPPFGISFTADALGASFALVATLLALICAVFAIKDIDAAGRRYGFYPFLLLMMAGVGGAFLTGDIFNLYVWFEVFLISSFGLLVLGSEHRQLDGAVKYAILNLVGTTLFLTATAYLYGIFGTLNMADIARKADALRGTAPLTTLAVLYLLAFGMKAAAFPVNFWLPASYHTPRVVTSALFGGVLTKIGIYALLRTLVMLFPPERALLGTFIGWVAAATMLLGVFGALAQTDLRRMMGFIVISGVGIMLAGLAVGTQAALAGTVLYAIHSMIVMTALYLLAGTMNEVGGSYSIRDLSGLYRAHPFLAAMALLLIFASAGLPPGSGLWPKIMLVKASIDASQAWLALAILATGFLTTLTLGRVFLLAFWRQNADVGNGPDGEERDRNPAVEKAHAGPEFLALTLLVFPILILGLYPEPAMKVARIAALGLADPAAYIDAVFPGDAGP